MTAPNHDFVRIINQSRLELESAGNPAYVVAVIDQQGNRRGGESRRDVQTDQSESEGKGDADLRCARRDWSGGLTP